MDKMKLKTVLSLMEFRLKHWQKQKKTASGTNKVCLVASISNIKDDINTIKRAIKLKENYERYIYGE